MKKLENKFSIQSYIEDNRNSIDESLISLRFMKQIDRFLEDKNITQRDFAYKIGCSESYISQLMSGIKKVNTSFINKFEKKCGVRVDFKLYIKEDNRFLIEEDSDITFSINVRINISTDLIDLSESKYNWTQIKNNKVLSNIDNTEYEIL